jgi:hypothetical protein
MPYTNPVRYPNALEQADPEGALNQYVIDNIADHEARIKTGIDSYTTSARDALTGVAAGTMIYNSTLGRTQVYFNSAWVDTDTFRTVGATGYSNTNVPPACRLINTANVSPYTAGNAITWNSESFDTDDMHSTTTNTDRITISTAGIYYVYGVVNATLASSAGSTMSIECRVNGSSSNIVFTEAQVDGMGFSAGTYAFSGSGLWNLAATDYLTLIFNTNNPGTKTITTASSFGAVRMGSAT